MATYSMVALMLFCVVSCVQATRPMPRHRCLEVLSADSAHCFELLHVPQFNKLLPGAVNTSYRCLSNPTDYSGCSEPSESYENRVVITFATDECPLEQKLENFNKANTSSLIIVISAEYHASNLSQVNPSKDLNMTVGFVPGPVAENVFRLLKHQRLKARIYTHDREAVVSILELMAHWCIILSAITVAIGSELVFFTIDPAMKQICWLWMRQTGALPDWDKQIEIMALCNAERQFEKRFRFKLVFAVALGAGMLLYILHQNDIPFAVIGTNLWLFFICVAFLLHRVVNFWTSLKEKLSKNKLWGLSSGIDIHWLVIAVTAAVVTGAWLSLPHYSYMLVLQLSLILFLLAHMMLSCTFTNLRVLTVVFTALATYDAFWVFVAPSYATTNTVYYLDMPKAVTSFFPLSVTTAQVDLPLYSCAFQANPFSCIDLLVPILLVSHCRRFDILNGREPILFYTIASYVFYIFGLLVVYQTWIYMGVPNTGLCVLLPCVLLPLMLLAWLRGELALIWTADFFRHAPHYAHGMIDETEPTV